MKTQGEVQHKLQQVRFRHLKKELEARLSEHPVNCKHLSEQKACKLHDVPCLQPPGRPACCGIFDQANDKEKLKEGMKEFFMTRPAAEIAVRFPDVAALMWVLDGAPPTEAFFEEFREEDLKSQIEVLSAELEENAREKGSLNDEISRLRALLNERDAKSYTDLVAALEGMVENHTKVAPPRPPWYSTLYRALFK